MRVRMGVEANVEVRSVRVEGWSRYGMVRAIDGDGVITGQVAL